ncbi:hypothetical protein DICSQDRAFT_166643 [Dichomitus squalens LYAD-421 SS1]|uniref:uncharacterized protein n=1 Tax=Dichomitus squalens (strain LYAD-421) TaxID=732165 RepID=UPI0004414445|nr:uncharacterized protein DICSQDRAFT_166643 [Dichomitus squalens LYAD-421 SS1]EJF64480.1 hypothetical protein DICSQDRAFT_166643 [Dichomitus squalens LYAD-421 SS1]
MDNPSPGLNSTAPAPPALPSLGSTFGAVLLGVFFSLILYGGILHQAYRYYRTYTSERLGLKTLVSATVLLETGHTAISMYICYRALVTDYANPASLSNVTRSVDILPALSGLIVALTQSFFLRRAYLFGKQYRPWALLVLFPLVLGFGFSIVDGFAWFSTCDVNDFLTHAGRVDGLDVDHHPDTCSASEQKWHQKNRLHAGHADPVHSHDGPTYKRVHAAGFRILATPHNLIYIAFSFLLTKLYTNSFLAALNTRQSLRSDSTVQNFGTDVFGSGLAMELRSGPSKASRQESNAVALELTERPASRQFGKISVHTTTTYESGVM